MAEERTVETIMNRIAPIAVSLLLLAAMCSATQAPRSTYDPAQQGAAQKSRQSFVDFTLRRINPSDKDYGRCLEEGRIVIIGETIKSAYFWSNVVSLSLLGCLFIVVVYQHHQRIGRESAMAEVLQQYEHALSRASAQVDEATTDTPPRKSGLAAFHESDRIRTLNLPPEGPLLTVAKSIEEAMKTGEGPDVRRLCDEFLNSASQFYHVPRCNVRVLAARPLRVRESSTSELFGDYDIENMVIRVWMRTAAKKEVTSFGTFLSTLCHEFCHHLDFQYFHFPDSWHTRGFYERTAVLYHHARATVPKRLFWAPVTRGRWRIDWLRTNRG